MATRLLDWTSNPLVAVWFACPDAQKKALEGGYVYALIVEPGNFADREAVESPLSVNGTMVYRPIWNNDRVAAQQGMFTLHAFAREPEEWIPLQTNPFFSDRV